MKCQQQASCQWELSNLVTGKYSEEKGENGVEHVEGGSVNGMMPVGSYLENTVNTVIENTVIGNTENTLIEN